jgi:16S rRNA (guanine527-N7)-methyltransferase
VIDAVREAALRSYLEEVLRANQSFNLTAVREFDKARIKHVLDSLEGLNTQLFETGKKVVDVGTGAGFPGVVLAIARPELEVLLLEATRKKCDFLLAATQQHAPNARVLCARAEAAGHDPNLRETFDVAVARAVGSFSEVLELCLPLVKVGGSVLLWRGQNARDEVSASKRALQTLGARARVLPSYRLPEHEPDYHLVRVGKTRSTPPRFPRRDGLPKQQPL